VGAVGAGPAVRKVIALPYLTYGTPEKLTVRGRVLKDEFIRPGESRWRNLVNFYRRLESDEVPGARVRAGAVEALSDREGYFCLELPGDGRTGWRTVDLKLVDPPGADAVARVLVPPAEARFGVISDIDDTIVASNVANKLKMLVTVALSNARTRKPFKGVAAFYRALHAGVNPVFYVSKSPWNLYVPLVEYLEVQKLPLGPLMLRDFAFRMPRSHKEKAIEDIFATYPGMGFVLIGDSAEADPEIYADFARRFPGRVLATYIRSPGVEADLAAAHAAAEGLIQPPDLRAVRSDIEADTRASKPSASRGSLK
jgi:phosphatidate phosphatase APP1